MAYGTRIFTEMLIIPQKTIDITAWAILDLNKQEGRMIFIAGAFGFCAGFLVGTAVISVLSVVRTR